MKVIIVHHQESNQQSFKMSLSIMIKETMDATLSRFGAEIAEKVVNICADKFGFSADTAFAELGGVLLSRQAKEPKQRREKVERPSFPLPYNGELNANLCQALRQNVGLYTQCQSAKKMGNFCKQCHVLSTKSEAGIPEYGLIEARKAAYDAGEEYTDPKGRKPVHYMKVMRKYKLTDADVSAEAEKFGIALNPSHLVVPASEGRRGRPAAKAKEPKEAKGKGRPKKEKKVIQIEGDDDDDLFASLVASANEDEDEEFVVKTSEEKAEKEAKRLQEKAEREAKLAAEKAEKDAKRAAEKEARELKLAQEKAEKEAREAKRLQEKAEREAKLAAEKAEREAKEAKRLQDKAEKEAKLAAEKAEKEAKKKAEKNAKKSSPSKKQEVEDDEEPEVVKKIVFNDKKYLVSKKSGVVYDYEKYVKDQDQVVVGKWSEEDKKIVFNSVEESEDEYESDDDESVDGGAVGGGVSGP